jgi:hypothetical protein
MSDNASNPFDPKRLGLSAEFIAEQKVSKSKKEKKQEQTFIIVPGVWWTRLTQARHFATYRVALHILRRDWEEGGGGKPFTLANSAMKSENVSRRQKWRSLKELEELGLVTIERCKRKSPCIIALHTKKRGPKA